MDPVKKEMLRSFLGRRLGTIRGVIDYHIHNLILETKNSTNEISGDEMELLRTLPD